MSGLADCGHVTVSGRALAVITTPAALRRLRAAYRSDAIYDDLRTITAIVLGSASATKIAIAAGDQDAWIMTHEAAQRLGVKPVTVRRMLREGRLRGTRCGRNWLVDPVDVVRRAAC